MWLDFLKEHKWAAILVIWLETLVLLPDTQMTETFGMTEGFGQPGEVGLGSGQYLVSVQTYPQASP